MKNYGDGSGTGSIIGDPKLGTGSGKGYGYGNVIGRGYGDGNGNGSADDSISKELELYILSQIPDLFLPIYLFAFETTEAKQELEKRLKGDQSCLM